MSKEQKPVAWRYENKNVKGNWYITWTEPPDGFNKRPLYESQDADRIEELERDLLNLVCRIHRDGGHYIAKYGEAKAIADADLVAARNNADLDALQANKAQLRDLLAWVDKYVGCAISGSIKEALSTTPEQSLARLRNQVREECAKLSEKHDSYILASEIRAMKEPE